MRKVTTKDLAAAFSKWAYEYYHFDKVKPEHPNDVLYAIRVWLIEVRRSNYSPELVNAIHRELSRRGALASAKIRKEAKRKKRLAEERKRQYKLF